MRDSYPDLLQVFTYARETRDHDDNAKHVIFENRKIYFNKQSNRNWAR